VHREKPFGGDGVLPADFTDWRFGVTYTVRPELLLPLVSDREYRITVAVRRRTGSFGDLYWRASAIAGARVALLNRPDLHTWIVSHGWRSIDIGFSTLLIAFLTIGLVCPNEGDAEHEGERPPAPEELMAPGGATLRMLQQAAPQRVDEIYIDFDHRDSFSAISDIATCSYGEYVATCEGIDFEPLVERAESLATFYSAGVLKIVRREWHCISDSNLAVVCIYFRL
jgi:hypothetical protein